MGKLTDIYDDSGNLVASIDLNEIIGINSINPNFSEIILSGGVKIGVMRNLKNIKSDYEIN